jgi:hypothetical protein
VIRDETVTIVKQEEEVGLKRTPEEIKVNDEE